MPVYTDIEYNEDRGGWEYSGVTLTKEGVQFVHSRKARGWERLRHPLLWFKPWITEVYV